jgi:NADH dehydrogenase
MRSEAFRDRRRAAGPHAGRNPHTGRVVVVGGGYAGLHAASAVQRMGVDVMVIDDSGSHDFVTRLAAVAGGTAPLSDASAPMEEFQGHTESARVTAVGDGMVELADGRSIDAEAVILTTGAEVSRPPIEGIEKSRGLRDADDAAVLRGLISAADSLVIVGAGATGVQLAGAASVSHPGLQVHLVESANRLLPGSPRSMGRGARRILRSRGVHVLVRTDVERFTDTGVATSAGEIDGLVVWAGGYSADASRLGLPVADNGRVLVDDDLLVEGMERTFAAGDVAAHLDRNGSQLPMSAQVAVRAGTAAGENAARLVHGEELQRVRISTLGQVVDLGGRRGVAQLGPLTLSGELADLLPPLLHDAIDLKDLLEIGGIRALDRAPSSVRSVLGLGPRAVDRPVRPASPLPRAAREPVAAVGDS